MVIPDFNLPRGELPYQVFYRPTPKALEWLAHYIQKRVAVDCGCGVALLGKELNRRGVETINIDLWLRDRSESVVFQLDATTFRFSPHMVVIVARPSAGEWVRTTLSQAVKNGAVALYIGKHYERDVSGLPFTIRKVMTDAGVDGESIWEIQEERLMSTGRRFLEWLIVKSREFPHRRPCVAALSFSGMLHWEGGASFCPFSKDEWDVLYREPYENDRQFETLYVKMTQTYPIEPQPVSATNGWISPEGRFYPCSYAEHTSEAIWLAAQCYGRLDGQRLLEERKWVSVDERGLVKAVTLDLETTEDLTQPQRDMLFTLAEMFEQSGKINASDSLYTYLRGYADEDSKPTHLIKPPRMSDLVNSKNQRHELP